LYSGLFFLVLFIDEVKKNRGFVKRRKKNADDPSRRKMRKKKKLYRVAAGAEHRIGRPEFWFNFSLPSVIITNGSHGNFEVGGALLLDLIS